MWPSCMYCRSHVWPMYSRSQIFEYGLCTVEVRYLHVAYAYLVSYNHQCSQPFSFNQGFNPTTLYLKWLLGPTEPPRQLSRLEHAVIMQCAMPGCKYCQYEFEMMMSFVFQQIYSPPTSSVADVGSSWQPVATSANSHMVSCEKNSISLYKCHSFVPRLSLLAYIHAHTIRGESLGMRP